MEDDFKKNNPKNLPVLSYSKLTTFKRCAKCYKFQYIDKLPKTDKPYTIFGKFCHSVLQSFHEYFLKNEIDKSKFTQVMTKCFKEQIKIYKEMTREQLDEAFDLIKKYLSYILNKKTIFPNVVSVEEKIWEEVDGKFIYYGFIDRLQLDPDGIFHVVDYKTTKDKKYLVKDDAQIKLYAYFIYLKNKEADKFRTSFILLKHNSEFMTKEYQAKDLIKAKNAFVELWEGVEKEKLFRATPAFNTCTICDYVEHCQEGSELMERKKSHYGKENAW